MTARKKVEHTVALEGGGEIVLVGALLFVGYLVFEHFAAAGADANGPSADNPVYNAVTGVERAITGDSTDSFGTWLYGVLHPSTAASTMATPSPAPAPAALDDLYSTSGGIG